MNLLKFPMRRFEGFELQLRLDRLHYEERTKKDEHRLRSSMYRQTNNHQYAQLSDRIGMTFKQDVPFTVDSGHPFAKKHNNLKPFNPDERRFKDCRYFFDTPGAVYKDQILSLLTTEELLKTVPRELIIPRTFTLRPFQTLFVGGLGRIDVVHARQYIHLTVFASNYMPIHVVFTEQARQFYEMYLGSDMLAVPKGGPERLSKWPKLMPIELDFNGISWQESTADIVLSSAGWVSVTLGRDEQCVLRAFTPEARGLFVRQPPVLPFAVQLKGDRVRGTPCFESPRPTVDNIGDDGYSQRILELCNF
jgi:hypothetical protein